MISALSEDNQSVERNGKSDVESGYSVNQTKGRMASKKNKVLTTNT